MTVQLAEVLKFQGRDRPMYGQPLSDYLRLSWGLGNTASRAVREREAAVEREVSEYIGELPFLWLRIDDCPGPDSLRGYIERNAIALLSDVGKPPLDRPSPVWLGSHSDRPRVRGSGLWNQNHVQEAFHPKFLATFDQLVDQQ